MNARSIMNAPVCLIENTPDGKLQVNPEALKILSQITQPVVVVTVVGSCRTGKSYLMNRLAGDQKVFDLGHTVQAKTKGIWMSCQPHPVKKDHVLVLLDTQGLGDVERCDPKQDMRMFTLALLLSSVIVYNSAGTIDQDAINKLHFVKQIANAIKVKAKHNDNEEAEFSRHLPSFIWAVRDFDLILEVDGKPVTEDEYLEHALKPQLPETNETTKEMNMLKNQLPKYFNRMKCFVFDRPTCDKTVLRRIEDVSDEQLDPSFVTKSKEFCDFVFNKAEVKRIKTYPINGTCLGLMAQEYTNSINSLNLVCMESALMNVSEIKNEAVVQEATKHYEDKMKERITSYTDFETFMKWSRLFETEALKMFMDKSLKDGKQKFQIEFVKNIEERKKMLSKMTEENSRRLCKRLINDLSLNLEENVAEGVYYTIGGYQMFVNDLLDIENKYRNIPNKGIQAEDILFEFCKSKMDTAFELRQRDNTLSQKHKEMEEEKAKAREREMEKKIQEEKESRQKQRNEDEERTAIENAEKMLEKIKKEKEIKQELLNRDIAANQIKLKKYENKNQGSEQVERLNQNTTNKKKQRENMDKPTWYKKVEQRLIKFLKGINIAKDKLLNYASELMMKVFCCPCPLP